MGAPILARPAAHARPAAAAIGDAGAWQPPRAMTARSVMLMLVRRFGCADVGDLSAESGDEVARNEVEVDAEATAADRDDGLAGSRDVQDDGPGVGRAERRDRVALVSG